MALRDVVFSLPGVGVAVVLASAVLLASAPALAQCDAGPDGGVPPEYFGLLRDTFPADQDLNVPTDGVVRIRFLGRAPTSPTFFVTEDSGRRIDGSWYVVGDEIVWNAAPRPGSDPLDRLRSYSAHFNDGSGGSNRITFQTGNGRSSGAPVFQGIQGVSTQRLGARECDPDATEITVRWNRATSPGVTPWPIGDLEYVIFQTRGPDIAGPRERDRVRLLGSGASGDTSAQRTFSLSGDLSSGPVCFNIQAVDPLGRTDGNRVEQCANPAQGNYFAGCTASPSRSERDPLGALSLGALALAALSARRRRRPAPRGPSSGGAPA